MAVAAEAGLNYSDLDFCDFLWLNAKLKARRDEQIFMWNVARFISFFAVKPHDIKNKIKNFNDLIEFEWERRPVVSKRFTEEEIKAFHASSVALFDKLKSEQNAGGINP